ncbi:MAG: sporulation protein YqfD [Eubacterium sp.]|nr:sporulation protein YqfD [Eubacterium sp.]
MKFFRGFLLVQVNGFSPERFLNLCSNKGIELWNMTPVNGGCSFCLSVQAFRELRPLLRKSGTRIKILRKYGLPFLLFRYRKRKMLFGGIAVAVCLMVWLSGFIWNIDVVGNTAYSKEAILDYLMEAGVSSGSRIKEIDCDQLETALRTDLGEISWVSVSIDGTKMTVELSESRNVGKQASDDDFAPVYDLVALKDATVYSIITRAGTPYVQAGTEVKAGDLLVGARMDLFDDAGEVYGWEYTQADADIIGITHYSYEDTFDLAYDSKYFTGEEKKYLTFHFGKYSVPLGAVGEYEHYETIGETWQLKLGTNFYLPFSIEKTRMMEYYPQKRIYSEEQAKQQAIKNLKKFCEKLIQNGIQITKKNVIVEISDSECKASGTIEVIEPLAKQKECDIVEFSAEEGKIDDGVE